VTAASIVRGSTPSLKVSAGETAIVTCHEGSNDDPGARAATNVFALEDGRLRMVHHHAGPIASRFLDAGLRVR